MTDGEPNDPDPRWLVLDATSTTESPNHVCPSAPTPISWTGICFSSQTLYLECDTTAEALKAARLLSKQSNRYRGEIHYTWRKLHSIPLLNWLAWVGMRRVLAVADLGIDHGRRVLLPWSIKDSLLWCHVLPDHCLDPQFPLDDYLDVIKLG